MLTLHLKPSRLELAGLVLCHGTALFAIPLTRLPGVPALLLAAAVLCSACYQLNRWRAGCPQRIQRLALTAQHAWVYTGTDRWHASLPRASYYSEGLIVLRLRLTDYETAAAGKRAGDLTVLVFADSLDAEAARRLRCFLRFGKVPAGSG